MRRFVTVCLLIAATNSHAETPADIRMAYSNQASQANAPQTSYLPSASRGEALFRQRFNHNDKMPACTSCHTDKPQQAGQHAITGKTIRPMATAANANRFTDPEKVEKWFGRNCKEVIGRPCTPAEKADFITYMSEVR